MARRACGDQRRPQFSGSWDEGRNLLAEETGSPPGTLEEIKLESQGSKAPGGHGNHKSICRRALRTAGKPALSKRLMSTGLSKCVLQPHVGLGALGPSKALQGRQERVPRKGKPEAGKKVQVETVRKRLAQIPALWLTAVQLQASHLTWLRKWS